MWPPRPPLSRLGAIIGIHTPSEMFARGRIGVYRRYSAARTHSRAAVLIVDADQAIGRMAGVVNTSHVW
jgi:hypothetical protein